MSYLPPASRPPIRLHGGGPAFGLPEVSPYTMKTEVQLQLAGLPYIHVRAQPADSPKGQLPFIIDGDVTVADSTFIRSYIEQKYGLDLDACLSTEQRAVAWAMERMAENQLGWVMTYFRYADDTSFETGPARWYDAVPEPQRSALRQALREKVMANLFAVTTKSCCWARARCARFRCCWAARPICSASAPPAPMRSCSPSSRISSRPISTMPCAAAPRVFTIWSIMSSA